VTCQSSRPSGDGCSREPIRPLGEDEHRRAEELYADLDAGIDRLIE